MSDYWDFFDYAMVFIIVIWALMGVVVFGERCEPALFCNAIGAYW